MPKQCALVQPSSLRPAHSCFVLQVIVEQFPVEQKYPLYPSRYRGCQCRKRDLNPHERNAHTDLNRARLPIPPFLHTCGRWDLNPHVYTDTRSLVLPVCQFQHSRFYKALIKYKSCSKELLKLYHRMLPLSNVLSYFSLSLFHIDFLIPSFYNILPNIIFFPNRKAIDKCKIFMGGELCPLTKKSI